MPLWGTNDADIDFEYPTEDEWAQMDANISLSSIEFEKVSNYVWVGSVKVNYSDGSSQYFKNEEY